MFAWSFVICRVYLFFVMNRDELAEHVMEWPFSFSIYIIISHFSISQDMDIDCHSTQCDLLLPPRSTLRRKEINKQELVLHCLDIDLASSHEH